MTHISETEIVVCKIDELKRDLSSGTTNWIGPLKKTRLQYYLVYDSLFGSVIKTEIRNC